MAKINTNYKNLPPSYFFMEIGKRAKAYLDKNPGVELMKLGIGNTTEALPLSVIAGLELGVKKLADIKTYTGYCDDGGDMRLRVALAGYYKKYGVNIDPEEVFISDGAKPDCANILSIFAEDSVVAVADPVYPVYVDSSIISGKKVVYMPCPAENGFVP